MGLRETRFRRALGRVGAVFGVLGFTAGACVALCFSVLYTPNMVNGVAYLAGAGSTDTFIAKANGEDCSGKHGCRPFTTGVLERTGIAVTWPGKVVPGSRFPVRTPFWLLGNGRTIFSGTGDAVGAIVGCLGLYIVTLLAGLPLTACIFLLVDHLRRREHAGKRHRGSL